MPDPTPARLRRAALLALVWWAADDVGDNRIGWDMQDRLDDMELDGHHPDTARAYLEAAQRELKAMEEGGERG